MPCPVFAPATMYTINGSPVTLRLDTGLTLVSIAAHLAEEPGLQARAPQQSLTANSTVIRRATRVDAFAFGPFDLHNVPANLKPGMAGHPVLLGMRVLRHLELTRSCDTRVLGPLSRG